MKRYWLFPLGICVAGCMVSNGLQYEAMSETNAYHLALVRKGMSEKEVLQIMHKPYSYETFEAADDIYDVWFYVTRATGLDQTRMVPQNLTPLTFKNGVLVGTGYQWYYYAMKEQADEVARQNPPPPKPKTQAEEDREFEKTLTPTNKPTKTEKNLNPIEKALSPNQEKKLPSNVRIVSQNELASGSCPEKVCGPNRFTAVSNGMTETQVKNVIGEPVKYETFELGPDVYDVWFYDRIASKTGKPSIVPQNMVPLTFRNAVLISQSDEDFFELKQKSIIAASQKEGVLERTPAAPKPSIFKPYVSKTPLGASAKLIKKVKKGMTEDQVMDLLGATDDQETVSIEYDIYDIWFYQVGSKKVPMIFKNGVLFGTTPAEYNKLKEKAGPDQMRGYNKSDEDMQQKESDQNFNYW